MKQIAFLLKIMMYAAAVGGCILGAAGSIPLAIANAEWDYYHETHRQLAGWLLCFTPMIIAFLAAAAHFVIGKKARVKMICLITAFVCALLPPAYILLFDNFSMLNLLSAILLFGFALIGLTLRVLVHESVIEDAASDLSVMADMVNSADTAEADDLAINPKKPA